MRLDALNVEQILLSSMLEISRARELMGQGQYYEKLERENIEKAAFSHMRLSESSKGTRDTKTNQLIDQTIEMASKRSISRLSRMKTNKKEFVKEINKYLNLTIDDEDSGFFTIDKINFEYVFSNFIHRSQSAEMFHILFSKLDSIIKELENAKPKNDPELILYYKIIKYKFLFAVDFDKYELTHSQASNCAKESLENIVLDDDFLLIAILQFAHIKWIRIFRELLNQDSENKITINDSVKPYISKFLKKIFSSEYEGSFGAYHNALIFNNFLLDCNKINQTFSNENFKINFNQSVKKLTQKKFNEIRIYHIRDDNFTKPKADIEKQLEPMIDKLKNYTKFSTETLDKTDTVLLVYNLYKFWHHRNSEGTLNLSLMRHNNIFIQNRESSENISQLIREDIIILEDKQDFFNHYSKNIPNREFQKVLLELFQKIFGNDQKTYYSNRGELLSFWKFRILVALENEDFNISEFGARINIGEVKHRVS